MVPQIRFTQFSTQGARRVSAMWQNAAAQPNWVSRVALLTFILVIGVPIFLLVTLALIAASFVFAILIGVSYVLMKIRGLLPVRDGRKSVRVIERREDV